METVLDIKVTGIKEPGERWKKMKQIWDSCEELGMEPPAEVADFFGCEYPEDNVVKVDLMEEGCLIINRGEEQSKAFVDMKNLPPGVDMLEIRACTYCIGSGVDHTNIESISKKEI